MPRIFTSLLLAATTHALSLPVVKQFGRIKGDGFKVRDLKGEGPNQGIVELWLGAASLNAATVDGVSRIQKCVAVPNSNIQLDFNMSVCVGFDATSSAVLRELDESNRFVQKSAESTSI